MYFEMMLPVGGVDLATACNMTIHPQNHIMHGIPWLIFQISFHATISVTKSINSIFGPVFWNKGISRVPAIHDSPY